MTIQHVHLVEYGTELAHLEPTQLSALTQAAGSRLVLRPSTIPGLTEIVATSYVGTIVTDAVQIVIQPKLAIPTLLYLLEVGGEALDLADELAAVDSKPELLPAIATLLVRLGEKATARGLHHRYRDFAEPLVAMRGRVDLKSQMRRSGVMSPVDCRFDEFTADVAENQVLKCAIQRVARLDGVPAVTRRSAARLLLTLGEVSDVDVRPQDIDRIIINRLNRHYLPALRLSRLILERASVSVAHGAHHVSAFLVDMNQVFETFVEHRLRRALRNELQVLGQHRDWLDVDRKVRIIPDYVLRRDGQVVFVADAKYKFTADGVARQSDYYQLLAYCTALGLPAGMLIYADTEGDLPPHKIEVRAAGVRVVTHRLSMGGSRSDIDAAVERLAGALLTAIADNSSNGLAHATPPASR